MQENKEQQNQDWESQLEMEQQALLSQQQKEESKTQKIQQSILDEEEAQLELPPVDYDEVIQGQQQDEENEILDQQDQEQQGIRFQVIVEASDRNYENDYKPPIQNPKQPTGQVKKQLQIHQCNQSKSELMKNGQRFSSSGKQYFTVTGKLFLKNEINTEGQCNQQIYGGGFIDNSKGHNEEITTMDVIHCVEQGIKVTYVATGQAKKDPKIIVWKFEENQNEEDIFCEFRPGDQRIGVKQVRFIPRQNQLPVLVSLDRSRGSNLMQFWEVKRGTFNNNRSMAHLTLQDMVINDMISYGTTDPSVIIATQNGVSKISYIKKSNQQYLELTNVFMLNSKNITSLCLIEHDTCYVGDSQGHVYFGSIGDIKSTCKQILKASRSGAIKVITYMKDIDKILVARDNDDQIQIWNKDFKKEYGIIKIQHGQLNQYVKSIDYFYEQNQSLLLVGTRGGKIILYKNLNEPKILLESHSNGVSGGISVTDDKIITTAEDNKVISYDIKQNIYKTVTLQDRFRFINISINSNQISQVIQPTIYPKIASGRCPCYHSQSGCLLVANNEGEIKIYDKDLQITQDYIYKKRVYSRQAQNQWNREQKSQNDDKNKKSWVNCMKASACGKFIAIADNNGLLKFLKYNEKNKSFFHNKVLKIHPDCIEQIDWGIKECSYYIRVLLAPKNIAARRKLNYYKLQLDINENIIKISLIKDENQLDVHYFTQNIVIGWGVYGIPLSAVSSDIFTYEDKQIIAVGDKYGYVSIYNYPVSKNTNQYRKYVAHSSSVTSVKFTPDGQYLVSQGQLDRATIIWKVIDTPPPQNC